MVIVPAEKMIAAPDDDLSDSALTETMVDASPPTPVETTFASFLASTQDGPNFTAIDFDGLDYRRNRLDVINELGV